MKIGRLNIEWNKKGQRITPGKPIFNLFGLSVLWNTTNSKSFIDNGYLANPDIFTVINRVTRTASLAQFRVYKIKNKAKHQKYKAWTGENATAASLQRAMSIKSETYEEVNDHPLNKLIEKPNPWQKAREFTENSIGFKLITGERFWHVVKLDAGANEGLPFGIYNLPPQHMIVDGGDGLLEISGYRFELGQIKELKVEEVIYSRYWNPDFSATGSGGHLRGVSPLQAGSKLMTRGNSILDRSVAMLQNAGAAGLLFEKPTAGVEGMTEVQAGILKNRVNREMMGTDNANAIGVANGDLGYIQFGLKGSEMELKEIENLNLEKICLLYCVPPVLFNTTRSIQNNLQEAKKELIISACFPELDSLRDDWNEVAKLYNEDIYVDYDASVYPELQEDLEKVNKINAASWWKTPNEKRLSEYMDEHKDPLMDEIIIPTGLMLLEDLGLNAVDNTLNNDGQGNRQGDQAALS